MRKLLGNALLMSCSLACLGQTSSVPALHVKKFVAPAYPNLARKDRFEGTTTSEVQVRADGTVESVKVTMAHPLFSAHVEQALKQWVFEPTGAPTTLKVRVKFSLVEGCDRVPVESLSETRVEADLPDTVSVSTCIEAIVTNTD